MGANSPFLFGKELWAETRIALFEQATDTRPDELKAQGVRPRVWFGERWITSIFDLFEENVRYFPALLPVCEDEDPVEVLTRGDMPELARAAPAQRDDLPLEPAGLRRRARAPAPARGEPGPAGRADRRRHARQRGVLLRPGAGAGRGRRPVWTQMSFSAAEENFHNGAKDGIDARIYWPGVGEVPATELVLRRLLPMAHEGLDRWGRPASATDCSASSSSAASRSATAPHGRPPSSTASTTTAASSARKRCAR